MSVSLKQSYDIEYNGTANVARMDLFVDTAGDLTGLTTFDSITLLQGSTAEDISTGDVYMMKTDGTWVKQPSQSAFANVYTKAEIDSMFYMYYTKTEADAMFEWITATITTDTLPLTFIEDGSPLISWSMKGNGSQQGTPTPDNPVMPEFVGVRTVNLFDASLLVNNMHLDNTTGLPVSYTGRIASPDPVDVSQYAAVTISYEASSPIKVLYSIFSNNELVGRFTAVSSGTVIDVSSADKMYICFYSTYGDNINTSYVSNIMLNSGSTALPYEPFGWKIPISCAGQTVPVYLGEVQTVRRIRKLMLDGTETITEESANVYSIAITDTVIAGEGVSTHFEYDADAADGQFRIDAGKVIFGYDDTLANFTAFLAAQYAAGTPVTVWYVLATEQTAIVNEPLAKIGDYADELSSEDAAVTIPTVRGENTMTIDTTLQPSEISITGKIREVTENEQ